MKLKYELEGAASPRGVVATRGARAWAATALNAVVIALDALADALQAPRAVAPAAPSGPVEFHCDAGAPEGALFVDGRFVGWIDGVKRL